MRSRIITIFCTALLAAGCGTSRQAVRTTSQQPQPQRVETHREYPVRDSKAANRPEAQANRQLPRPVRPTLRFSDAETQHVRLSTINYFPAGGIELSLDDLNGEFCYPLRGKLISDYGIRSGRMHTGIDIKAIPNDTIRAAFPGVVRMSKDYSSYGNIVVIRHYQGFETVYAHGSKNLVSPNDVVEAGDPIALAGRTGRATTEHLHFEVRAGGEHFDPKLVVDPQGMVLRGGKLFIRNHNGAIAVSTTESGVATAGDEALAARADYDAARAQAIAESTVNGKPKGPAEPEAVYYRVQKGDTLGAIARKHGTTVNKICQLNKIKSTALLQINQRLRVK